MQFINNTDLMRSEEFIRSELESWKTEFPRNRKLGTELQIVLKWSNGKAEYAGYFRYKDFVMNCRINKRNTYPFQLKQPVSSKQLGGGRFKYIWDGDYINSHDEMMVWTFAHELWHFLCVTKQQRGNYETKANRHAFDLLKKYRKCL